MATRVFCIGNGESRQSIDLLKLRPHGKIYGCNALYRDFTPDVLTAVDHGIMHEIYQSGYCDTNETWLRNWTRIPAPTYDMLVYGNMKNEDKELIDKYQSNKMENDKGDKQEFVFHGSNLSGKVNILKSKLEKKQIVEKNVNHTTTYVSWTNENDKAHNLDDLVEGQRDRGWACGASSGRVATIREKDLTEMYLIGHDLVSDTHKINNMYKGTKHYGLPEAGPIPAVNWINQWKTLMTENPNVQFYKVNPDGDKGKTPVSSKISEWTSIQNLKYISFQNTLDKFSKV
ncbi:hypothetical protein N9J01_00545 [bacterium]|nr:hypothetical protein [bacterium]